MKFSISNRDIVGSNSRLSESFRNIVIHDDNGEEINVGLEIQNNKLIITNDNFDLEIEVEN